MKLSLRFVEYLYQKIRFIKFEFCSIMWVDTVYNYIFCIDNVCYIAEYPTDKYKI